MNLVGKKTLLRAIEESDLEFLRDMINDPEVEKMVEGTSFPVSKQDQFKWYESLKNSENNLRCIIENGNEEAVGYISLSNIDWKNRTSFLGFKISSKQRRQGYAKDSISTLIKYAFEELNLNRIESTIIEYNKPSLNLLTKKLDWMIEGNIRKSVFKNNKYNNQYLVSILKSDYMKPSKSNNNE